MSKEVESCRSACQKIERVEVELKEKEKFLYQKEKKLTKAIHQVNLYSMDLCSSTLMRIL
jgi:hypothetical protein